MLIAVIVPHKPRKGCKSGKYYNLKKLSISFGSMSDRMATKLIKLGDGTLIEVEVPAEDARQIGFGDNAVNSTFDKIQPILLKTCRPIVAAWQELNQEMYIEQAEVEIGFSFEGEGNIYVTKAKASSNVKVKLILKPSNKP